jgi:hypothetical protein
MEVAPASAQVDQRIPHHLSRSVPGDLAAAVDPLRRDRRIKDMGRRPASADGVDRGVFQKQQGLILAALGNGGGQSFLEIEGLAIGYQAAIDDLHIRSLFSVHLAGGALAAPTTFLGADLRRCHDFKPRCHSSRAAR